MAFHSIERLLVCARERKRKKMNLAQAVNSQSMGEARRAVCHAVEEQLREREREKEIEQLPHTLFPTIMSTISLFA